MNIFEADRYINFVFPTAQPMLSSHPLKSIVVNHLIEMGMVTDNQDSKSKGYHGLSSTDYQLEGRGVSFSVRLSQDWVEATVKNWNKHDAYIEGTFRGTEEKVLHIVENLAMNEALENIAKSISQHESFKPREAEKLNTWQRLAPAFLGGTKPEPAYLGFSVWSVPQNLTPYVETTYPQQKTYTIVACPNTAEF